MNTIDQQNELVNVDGEWIDPAELESPSEEADAQLYDHEEE